MVTVYWYLIGRFLLFHLTNIGRVTRVLFVLFGQVCAGGTKGVH